MEFTFKRGSITLPNKELTALDRIVIDFISLLSGTRYVIVSGYVAILFGRGRNTEDIDIFIQDLGYARFSRLYDRIMESGRYYCINAEDARDAYELLNEKASVRFAEKDTIDPNFEIKFPQNELHLYSLRRAVTVALDRGHSIRVGPIELQIAYKLRLGSEKDYEDAAHLYVIFKDNLDRGQLKRFLGKLRVRARVTKKILGEEL